MKENSHVYNKENRFPELRKEPDGRLPGTDPGFQSRVQNPTYSRHTIAEVVARMRSDGRA